MLFIFNINIQQISLVVPSTVYPTRLLLLVHARHLTRCRRLFDAFVFPRLDITREAQAQASRVGDKTFGGYGDWRNGYAVVYRPAKRPEACERNQGLTQQRGPPILRAA